MFADSFLYYIAGDLHEVALLAGTFRHACYDATDGSPKARTVRIQTDPLPNAGAVDAFRLPA